MALVLAGATAALGASATPAIAGDDVVKVRDACDPASFNAVLGEGACAPATNKGSRVTFDEFVEEAAEGGHGAWKFSDEKVRIDRGESVVARYDRGGEMHTFSEVANFGPGCVPEVNALLGYPPPFAGVPECSDPARWPNPAEFVGPGTPDVVVSGLSKGRHRFICFIHPWMKTTVEVR